MMLKVTILELKKAFFSKSFFIGATLLIVFSVLSAVYCIENNGNYNPDYMYKYLMENGNYTENPDFPIYSLFENWVGGEHLSLASILFYYLLPIVSAIPYSWSYYRERKNGYIKNILSRTKKSHYISAKLISVFLTGFVVVLIPIVVNILLVSAYIPYCKPNPSYIFYNNVFFGNMGSDLFFSHPFLHMFAFTLFDAFYGGVFALFSLSISCYMENIVAIIFGPFFLMLIGSYIENLIINNCLKDSLIFMEYIPIGFLHAKQFGNQVLTNNVLIVTSIILLFSIITVYVKGIKDEVY